jgi:hypothetical protein
MSCLVEVNFSEKSWVDEELAAEYQQLQYEYVLTWEDAAGEPQIESLMLAHGEKGLFEAEIPYDTEYAVTVLNPDGSFVTEFSENHEATVDSTMLKEHIQVEATLKYAVEVGEALTVSLVKVDAATKRPLPGVTFDLYDPEGLKIRTCTSDENGEMILSGMFHAPGTYILKEVTTVEGYVLLKEPVPVNAVVSYELNTEKQNPVLMQTLTAEITHRVVVPESDGSYWIENEPDGTGTEESGGMGLGTILLIGAGVAAAGGTAAYFVIKKKRKTA